MQDINLDVLNRLFHYLFKKEKEKKEDNCEGSGSWVFMYMFAILPS